MEERREIAKQFFKNFVDNFIETIKLLSISEKEFDKRATINFDEVRAAEEKGLNIQFHSGHQMNWEYASLAISRALKIPWLAVYKGIAARPVDRLFLKIRGRYGAVMVERDRFKNMMPQLMKKQYALGLIADQNPATVARGYWLNFFNKPGSFLTGPEKGAMRNKTAVVFVNIVRLKRGYFRFDCKMITEDGSKTSSGELTRMYRDFLEQTVREQPDNYLWSHRRWKYEWKKEYERRWIDTVPFPQIPV